MGEDCIQGVWLLLICLLKMRMRRRLSPSPSLAGLFLPLFLPRRLGMKMSVGRRESCGLGRRGSLAGKRGGAAWGRSRGGTATLIWSTKRHARYSTATTVLPLSSALLAVTRSTPDSSRAFTLDASIARGNHTVRSNCEFTL